MTRSNVELIMERGPESYFQEPCCWQSLLRVFQTAMTITVDLRAALTDIHVRRTLFDISRAVVRSKRIVVVTGAGISCSCGIPV